MLGGADADLLLGGASVLLQAEKAQIKTEIRTIRRFSLLNILVQIIICIFAGQRLAGNAILTFDPMAEVN